MPIAGPETARDVSLKKSGPEAVAQRPRAAASCFNVGWSSAFANAHHATHAYMTFEAILNEELALPESERAVLRDKLAETLGFTENAEVQAAQVSELRRRIDELAQGRVEPIPGDVFVAQLRAKLDA